MTREALLIATSGLLLFIGGAASANPWLKDDGAIEAISSTTTSREQTGLAASLQSSSSLHIEYGASDRATLIVDGSFQRFTSGTASGTSFDNAWAGVRMALKRWDNSLLSTEWVAGISDRKSTRLNSSHT